MTSQKGLLLPGTKIDGVMVGGRTSSEALELLQDLPPVESSMSVEVGDISVASSAAQLQLVRDIAGSVERASQEAKASSGLKRLGYQLGFIRTPPVLQSSLRFDESALTEQVLALKAVADIEGAPPGAILGSSGVASTLSIFEGKIGRSVEVQPTLARTQQLLETQAGNELPPIVAIKAFVSSTSTVLDESQINASRERATKLVGKRVSFRTDRTVLELSDQEVLKLLALPTGYQEAELQKVLDQLTERVNRPGRDATFEYDPITLSVKKFEPPLDGYILDRAKAQEAILLTLQKLESEAETLANVEVPITTAPPAKTLAGTNDLGIQERIGFGESHYRGSIPTRIHNVSLASQRINNYILPPGKEFSFNDAVGDVSAATGFKAAYVIKGGRTELGDGGGVCQVSTTLFRAVLHAGLKVTRRVPHSYRVGYYEQGFKPGIDATVYSGNVDLRFMNDTNHHVLIHTVADSDRQYMTVELFGTSDGRRGEITNHRTWGFSPPPPAEYYPDASLPHGRVRQIDWSASGIKAEFTNVIKDREGNIIREDTYFSNYRPWSAKYLRGV